MNLQNHKQQEINFNKETNSKTNQKQQKLDFSNPTQKQSQVKLDSKSTASSFKNQSSSNSWQNLVLESQKSISHLRPFCDRFFRTNETNFTNRPSQNVLIEKSFLNQNQSLENRQEKRKKQIQNSLLSVIPIYFLKPNFWFKKNEKSPSKYSNTYAKSIKENSISKEVFQVFSITPQKNLDIAKDQLIEESMP